MKTCKLKRTKQCAKCPWRKDVDPHDIPNGYSEEKHAALKDTIADPASPIEHLMKAREEGLRVMACHETHDAHCVGWLHNQLGEGSNIPLRLSMQGCENLDKLKVIGEQHPTFEDTLPKSPRIDADGPTPPDGTECHPGREPRSCVVCGARVTNISPKCNICSPACGLARDYGISRERAMRLLPVELGNLGIDRSSNPM